MLPQLRRFLTLAVTGIWILSACSDHTPTPDPGQSQSPTPTEPTPIVAGSGSLAITPVFQQTPEWCWAASSEMVFRYYGLPSANPFGNYQCGIIALAAGPLSPCFSNCLICASLAGGSMSTIQTAINGYGAVLNQLGIPSPTLTSALVFRPLSQNEIKTEIAAGRPIVAGIDPTGIGFALPNASQHIVVISGYDFSSTRQVVTVDDPFPYQFPPFNASPNPYLAAGATQLSQAQYVVPWAALTTSLRWANTIYFIRRQ